MKKPETQDSQVVWMGVARPLQAEIFQPDKGGYKLAGHGGDAGMPKADKSNRPRTATGASAPAVAQAPALKEKPKSIPAIPQAQSKALAETVVGSLVDRLTAEAKRKGGSLSIQDLQGLTREFAKKTEALQAVFEKSFEEYVKVRERAAFQQNRQYPFDRLIVETFAPLFVDDAKLANDPRAISRRVLPGFFMALSMMLGPQSLETYQNRCRKIVDRYKKLRGDEFSWLEIYADEESKALVLDALVAMVPHFADPHKRAHWMAGVVNGHMPPYDGDENSPAAHWQMEDSSFFALVLAMFSGLKSALADPTQAARLRLLHGGDACDEVAEIIRHIEAEAKKSGF